MFSALSLILDPYPSVFMFAAIFYFTLAPNINPINYVTANGVT